MLALYTHLLCIFGTYIACRRSFKTYIAISSLINYAETSPSLPLPNSKEGDAEKNKESSESSKQSQTGEEVIKKESKWRKFKNSDLPIIITLISSILAFTLFLLYGLPKITSNAVIKVIWIMMTSYTISNNIYSTLQCLLPQPQIDKLQIRKLDKKREGDESQYKYNSIKIPNPNQSIPWFTTKRFLIVLSTILTGSLIISAYFRNYWLSSIVAFSQVISFAGRTFYPKVSIKFAFKLVLGLLTFAMTIGHITSYIYPNKNKPEEKQEKDTPIPEWLLDVYMMYNAGMGIMLPSGLLAITQRFEYLTSTTYLNHKPIAEEGEIPTPIPNRDIPNFKKPITSIGFISLISSIVFYHTILPKLLTKPLDTYLSMIGIMFFAFPVTAFGMFVTAWYMGNLGEWLNYTDKWYPYVEDVDGFDRDDQEKERNDINVIEDHLNNVFDEKHRDPVQT